jgi:hypothetical protein
MYIALFALAVDLAVEKQSQQTLKQHCECERREGEYFTMLKSKLHLAMTCPLERACFSNPRPPVAICQLHKTLTTPFVCTTQHQSP